MRKFIISSVIFVVMLFIWQNSLFAEEKNRVEFSVNEGVGGCGNCGNSVSKMLKDPAKQKELQKIFPENSKVVFYVREPEDKTKIPKNVIAITVGSCASTLKSDNNLYIPGCRRQIDSNYIFRMIIANKKKFAAKIKQNTVMKKENKPALILHIEAEKNKPQQKDNSSGSVKQNNLPVAQRSFRFPKTWDKWIDAIVLIFAMILWSIIIFCLKSKRRSVWIMSIAVVGYFGFYRGGCPCPLGTIGNLILSIADGALYMGFISIIFFLAPLLFALICGRVFCSSACPIGAIQEFFSWKQLKIPRRVEYVLRLGKYIVFFLIIYMALRHENTSFFCKLDPFISIFTLSGTMSAFIIAFIFLALSLFLARPFCRWFCPYAVLLVIISKFSIKKRKIHLDKCIDCKLCEKACPMQCVTVPKIDSGNCVLCDKCRIACPKGAIE